MNEISHTRKISKHSVCATVKKAKQKGLSYKDVRLDGRRKLVRKLQNRNLLIIDEWLSSALDDKQVAFMFELIESRYQNGSTIFCTQFAQSEWLARLGGGPQDDAITDRIVHDSAFFNSRELNMWEMQGTSYSYTKAPA